MLRMYNTGRNTQAKPTIVTYNSVLNACATTYGTATTEKWGGSESSSESNDCGGEDASGVGDGETSTVGMENFPDVMAAKGVVEELGGSKYIDHKIRHFTPDEVFNTIPKIIYHMDT